MARSSSKTIPSTLWLKCTAPPSRTTRTSPSERFPSSKASLVSFGTPEVLEVTVGGTRLVGAPEVLATVGQVGSDCTLVPKVRKASERTDQNSF